MDLLKEYSREIGEIRYILNNLENGKSMKRRDGHKTDI